jgi:hypothetical protein
VIEGAAAGVYAVEQALQPVLGDWGARFSVGTNVKVCRFGPAGVCRFGPAG